MSNHDQLDEFREKRDAEKELLKKHRLIKHMVNLYLRTHVRIKFKGKSLPPDSKVGLLDGSIISNPLFYPHEDDDWLDNKTDQPGKWVAYDYKRPQTFPDAHKKRKVEQLFNGRLVAFLADEMQDKSKEEPTPVGMLNLLDVDHVLSFDIYTPDQLIQQGMLEKSTYGDAYQSLGIYKKYMEELGTRRLTEEPLFQVTPKGNTLIVLLPDFGERAPKEDTQTSPVFIPGLRQA